MRKTQRLALVAALCVAAFVVSVEETSSHEFPVLTHEEAIRWEKNVPSFESRKCGRHFWSVGGLLSFDLKRPPFYVPHFRNDVFMSKRNVRVYLVDDHSDPVAQIMPQGTEYPHLILWINPADFAAAERCLPEPFGRLLLVSRKGEE